MLASRHSAQLASVALSVAAVVGFTQPASASIARHVELPSPFVCKPYNEPCGEPPVETALIYQGGREANRVTLATVAGGIRISDTRAVIEPGRGCVRADDHSAICSPPSSTQLQTPVFVAAGGGADRVTSDLDLAAVEGAPPPENGLLGVSVDGGPGNDVLVGGPGSDRLFGGAGSDRLRGRGGDDSLHDVSPRDFLPSANQPDPALPPIALSPGRRRDSFDGGAGNDTLTYDGRAAKLRINLANRKRVAGAWGERDSIRRVENAIGGGGDDRMAGTRGANQLAGGKGDDLLAGRGGGDLLKGQDGRDVIRGGSGDDSINLEPPSGTTGGDRVSCGAGSDSSGTAFPQDFLSDDCEQISPSNTNEAKVNVAVRSLLPLRKGREPRVLSGSLECYIELVCQVRAELRVHGRVGRRGTAPSRGTLLGSQTFTARGQGPISLGPPAEQKMVDLRVSSDGLRLLRRHRALRVRVILASQYSGTEPPGDVTLLRTP